MEKLDQLKVSVALRNVEDAASRDDKVSLARQLRDLRLLMTEAGAIYPSMICPIDYLPHKSWNYKCNDCGANECKLWREYQACNLLCANCVEKRTKRKLDPERLHSIEWWIAAIPDEEGNGYWGYTSVPEAGVRWWNNLPTTL